MARLGDTETNRGLRIAVVCESPPDAPDGVSRYAHWLVERLREGGHDVVEIRPRLGRRARVGIPANGNIVTTPLGAQLPVLPPGLDVVHVQLPCSPLYTGRLIRRLAPTTALVATFHATPRDRKAEIALTAAGLASSNVNRRTDQTLAVSAGAARAARRTHGLSATVLGPVLSPLRMPEPRCSAPTGTVVAVGRLVERKEFALLIAAFAVASKGRPDWRLNIVGEGPLRRRLEQQIESSGLSARVRLLGQLAEADKRMALLSADLVCVPHGEGESFGMVVVEGMQAGAVVLAADNPGHRFSLGGAVHQLVDATSAQEFGERITQLMIDDAARAAALIHQRARLASLSSPDALNSLISAYAEAKHRRGERSKAELPADLQAPDKFLAAPHKSLRSPGWRNAGSPLRRQEGGATAPALSAPQTFGERGTSPDAVREI